MVLSKVSEHDDVPKLAPPSDLYLGIVISGSDYEKKVSIFYTSSHCIKNISNAGIIKM